MTTRDIVMAAAGVGEKPYVEDVFNTYLYTGNSSGTSTQPIINDIPLAPTSAWDVFYPKTLTARVSAVDSTGALYVGGRSSLGRAMLIKYSSTGSIIWQRELTYGSGTYANTIWGICFDSSNNVYTCSSETYDLVIHKIDSSGNVSSTGKVFTGDTFYNGTGQWSKIISDSNNNLYVAATLGRDISGTPTAYVAVLKLDSSLNASWQSKIANFATYARDLALNPAQTSVYVCGYTTSDVFESTAHSYVYALDTSTGTHFGKIAAAESSTSIFSSIEVDSSGNIYVTGSGSFTGEPAFRSFLVKFNSSGTILWQRVINTITAHSIHLDSSNVYFSATFGGSGNYSTYLIKFDTSGNTVYQSVFTVPYEYGSTWPLPNMTHMSGDSSNVFIVNDGGTIIKIPKSATVISGSLKSSTDVLIATSSTLTVSTGAMASGSAYTPSSRNTVITTTSPATTGVASSQTSLFFSRKEEKDGGGLVWLKSINGGTSHRLVDTVRGADLPLYSNLTTGQGSESTVNTFNANGFTIGNSMNINTLDGRYVAWTFRKTPKFFDIVTYVGNNASTRNISHNLQCTPGLTIVRNMNVSSSWVALFNSVVFDKAAGTYTSTSPGTGSSSTFQDGSPGGNATGVGCGGGGASWWGGRGGNGYFGGGGGGSTSFASSFSGGAGGNGFVLIQYGQQNFLFTGSSTSWTIPGGSTTMKVWACGGGGSGGGSTGADASSGGGGGAGGIAFKTWTIAPGVYNVSFTIGAGGTGAAGSNGGATSVTYNGVTITGNGGNAGTVNGAGGTGGGFSGGDGGAVGGNGLAGAPSDIGGGGGGATGAVNAPDRATTNVGGNGAQSADVGSLFSSITGTLYKIAIHELTLNTTNPTQVPSSVIGSTELDFSVSVNLNASTNNYVAYLFANDVGGFGMNGSESVIKCGEIDGFPPGGIHIADLGWEPQWVLVKRTTTDSWYIIDSMRGFSGVSGFQRSLSPDTANTESNINFLGYLTPTGFRFEQTGGQSTYGDKYIYVAIRRGPMKTPTVGSSVFSPVLRSSDGTTKVITTPGFPPDAMLLSRVRNSTVYTYTFGTVDKLRGTRYLEPATTVAEANGSFGSDLSWNNLGYVINSNSVTNLNINAINYVEYVFRRAPGFFDVVLYTGTGSALTVPHSLRAIPDLIITKGRTTNSSWTITKRQPGNPFSIGGQIDQDGTPLSTFGFVGDFTTTSFTAGYANTSFASSSGVPYVAYLFASLSGVSKVGEYTGNGTSQTINCGFTTGARFVLIKLTNSPYNGNYNIWDSARGIVSANDPYVLINNPSTATGEPHGVTNDSVDPHASGFIVNQVAATNINVNALTYIFLAIA